MPTKVLVVDDDPLTCELISEILRTAGMEASSFTDGAEAASRLREEKFHAVFLDMRMPPPDGVELARQLRASRVNASTVIVMITGEEDRTLMGRAFEAGVGFFLFKPVERNKLLRLIRATEGPIEREKRRFTRVKLRCFEGKTLDLSLNGILVQAQHSFPPETVVTVSLELAPGTRPCVQPHGWSGRLVPIAWGFNL